MKNLIARFVKNESGATANEFGLIAAGISFAVIALIAVATGLSSNSQVFLSEGEYLGTII